MEQNFWVKLFFASKCPYHVGFARLFQPQGLFVAHEPDYTD